MIWVSLAIAVVSFLLIALLAPKPEVEDARAGSLEDLNFPQASEDAPIAIALGTVRVRAPNTIWYGSYEARPKYETIKTGLFSSTTYIVGYDYYLALDLALCLGDGVVLREIVCDEEVVWSGTLTDDTEQSIDQPELFGGPDEGGGLIGNFRFYPGSYTQDPDPYLESVLGTGEVPGYNGVSHVVFYLQPGEPDIRTYYPDPFPPSTEPIYGFDTLTPFDPVNTTTLHDLHDYATQSEIDSGIVKIDEDTTLTWTNRTGGISSSAPSGKMTFYDADYNIVEESGIYQYGQISSNNDTVTITWGFNPAYTVPSGARYFIVQRGLQIPDDTDEYDWTINNVTSVIELTVTGAGTATGMYIGESNQLRQFNFLIERFTNDLSLPNNGKIGDSDLNPVEAIYQIMTDNWIGLGMDPSTIDTTDFVTQGTTLHSEGNGVSILVTSQQQARTLLSEILRQIDGFLYQDPATQKVKLKLIRDDYTPASLTIYDEDDILQVKKYSKSSWEEIVSEVKVSYKDRNQESDKIALAQDMAAIDQIGRPRSVTQSFPFCYDDTLATKIAARELSQQSIPLFVMTVEMNRGGYDLLPGEVIKISWPDYGLSEVIMRIQKPDLGSLIDGKIVLDLIQDSFASDTVVFADPEDSLWADPISDPVDVSDYLVINSPAFFSRKLDTGVADDAVQPIVIPRKPQEESDAFSVVGGLASGDLTISDVVGVAYPATGTLVSELSFTVGLEGGYSASSIALNNVEGVFTGGTEAEIFAGEAGLIYVDGEIMGIVNAGLSGWQGFYRGLFGTPIKTHAAGTRVYQIGPQLLGNGDTQFSLTDTDTYYFKILDITDGVTLGLSVATERNYDPTAVITLPLRPRDVQVDGEYNKTINGSSAFDITAKATSRNTGASYPKEDDAAETPVDSETYNIRVYNGNGSLLTGLNADGVTLPYSMDFTQVDDFSDNGTGEVRVYAVSSEGTSLGYGSAQITIEVAAFRGLLTSGDEQSGTDVMLTSGDAQSGTDKIILTGDANLPLIVHTSGDEQSGGDTILLSGDEQSGTDQLMYSGDEK